MTNKHQGWQPIASCPDDGWVLCRWFATDNSGQSDWRVVQARKEPTLRARGYFETWDNRLFSNPSNWMPLPDAPPPEQEGGL